MTSSLPASTQHRLQQLPQIPSVWEGDRRPLNPNRPLLDHDHDQGGDCILWVDGSEGLVRSMDVIPEEAGLETVVRTLIRAMEMPRSPAPPCRPKKIVVRNREIQFFLRGVLQGLDISIDYQPNLPLIDELFRSFESPDTAHPDPLPPEFAGPLGALALDIWQLAPWDALADHDIIALELVQEEPQTLYACVMGMLGQEYGIILYRSLESLRQFREMALSETSPAALEQGFLSQDCWFLNYEFEEEEGDRQPEAAGEPIFGSIHPLEGIRPFLDEAEALTLYFALEGLRQFVKNHRVALSVDPIPDIQQRLRIRHPLHPSDKRQEQMVNVSTQAELAAELIAQLEEEDDDDDFPPGFFVKDNKPNVVLQDDLIPDNAYMSLGMIPWDLVEMIRVSPNVHYQPAKATMKGDGMPVLMIQTSRPKAKALIDRLRKEGPVTGLGFNLGQDPWTETQYDLGILQTRHEKLFLFGEFLMDSATHQQARKNWERRCKATKGYCAVLIAMGITGGSKGNPKLQHMLAYFETEFLTPQDLGIGPLQLMPNLDFDV